MHPMFRQLFIQADADDLLAEEDRRRRVSRARRARSAMIIRPPPAPGSADRGRNQRPACCAAGGRTCPSVCWRPRRHHLGHSAGAPLRLCRAGGTRTRDLVHPKHAR